MDALTVQLAPMHRLPEIASSSQGRSRERHASPCGIRPVELPENASSSWHVSREGRASAQRARRIELPEIGRFRRVRSRECHASPCGIRPLELPKMLAPAGSYREKATRPREAFVLSRSSAPRSYAVRRSMSPRHPGDKRTSHHIHRGFLGRGAGPSEPGGTGLD